MTDGLSTREEASEISGRGVGLSAVREACVRSGGQIAITSTPKVGTVFRFSWAVAASGRPLAAVSGIPVMAEEGLSRDGHSVETVRLINAG
jgi:signal transduction histidine kinase